MRPHGREGERVNTRATTFAAQLLVVALAGCTTATPGAGDGGLPGDAGPATDGFSLPDALALPDLNIQFVDPDNGPYTGGTEVTVRGNGFTEDATVLFGGREVEPLDFTFVDSRRILVLTPPGTPGLADVEVRVGDESAALADGFEYEAISVDPDTGSVAGGTYVTLQGFGTHFDDTTTVTFDGAPMTGIEVMNQQRLSGFAPPGVAGSANVRAQTGAEVHLARNAYTYVATADPFAGGMGGGPINGTLNVVVLDSTTSNGVDGAYVVVGDPQTSPLQGTADDLGQITFSTPGLVGPVTVTAAALGYETTVFAGFDAQDITIFLNRPPDPQPGPYPPGRQNGHIYGHVLFGETLGIGSPHWDLVPEPRTPTEVKRLYVTTTASSVLSRAYPPGGWIEYEGFDPDKTAWAFDTVARPAAQAVVAIAGLYDPARDPSGMGVTGFEPFAMGVTRGILVGPGEDVMDVDVVVNIPLDTALLVDLDNPPALNTPGWNGPIQYSIRPFVDFGGEGVIAMNKNGLNPPPVPEPAPNIYYFEDDSRSILLPSMSPFAAAVADASYSFIIGAYSAYGSNPFSVRIARGIDDVSLPITVGDFLAMPRPVDPRPNQTATSMAVRLELEPPSTGEATFNLHMFTSATGDSLLRIFSRGDMLENEIPDLTGAGLPAFPSGPDQSVGWTFYRITIPGTTFDQFTYRHLSAYYWSAYAADSCWVYFP